MAKTDTDFDPIRTDERFQALVTGAMSRQVDGGFRLEVMSQDPFTSAAVTVSADLQLTIPSAVGKSLGLSEGQRFQVVQYQGGMTRSFGSYLL